MSGGRNLLIVGAARFLAGVVFARVGSLVETVRMPPDRVCRAWLPFFFLRLFLGLC